MIAQANRRVTLEVLEERLNTLIDTVEAEKKAAADHRQALRDVIAANSLSLNTLTDRVATLGKKVDEDIKPVVDDYKERRAEARGAAKLAKLLWAMGIGLSGLAGAYIGKKLG